MLTRATKEPFVVHHNNVYGDLPIWVAIEILDFGSLSKLFSGMIYSDQQKISSTYGAPTGNIFSKWLRSLTFIRNISAHHGRLWNINIIDQSPLNLIPENPELQNNRPFFYFCLMQQLMKIICPKSTWSERFKNLLDNDFPKTTNGKLSLKDMGVIEGWENWDIWKR